MIRSMTGFGQATAQTDKKKYTVEIKTLNGKQADLHLKIPQIFRETEQTIRNLAVKTLVRGKMEVSIWIENILPDRSVTINRQVILDYLDQLQSLNEDTQLPGNEVLIPMIMRFPEVLTPKKQEPDSGEWTLIETLLKEALDKVNRFRMQEGKAMEVDLRQRVNLILEGLEKIGDYESQRIETIRNRLEQSISEIREKVSIDPNRLEQELIYYLEKLDITEEKVRLRNHCSYFLETMGQEDIPGRKLGFISQEMGREINTLGSKAGNAPIQKIVVNMKDELEKIKEQLLNVL
ncbi:MAG: YicC family protein [Bacteroidales bacterium]|nr:YicC family protein [Bacteroidales bacterium]